MGKFLCMEIISDTNCSYTDLITVMKTVKSGYNFL